MLSEGDSLPYFVRRIFCMRNSVFVFTAVVIAICMFPSAVHAQSGTLIVRPVAISSTPNPLIPAPHVVAVNLGSSTPASSAIFAPKPVAVKMPVLAEAPAPAKPMPTHVQLLRN